MWKLSLFSFAVLTIPAFAAVDIHGLLEKSKTENKACEARYLHTEALGGALIEGDNGSYFADKDKTLKVAMDIKAYSGVSPTALELTQIFIDRFQKNESLDDYPLTFEIPLCRTIGYFKLGKALAESTKHYKFVPEEIVTIKQAVLNYIDSDNDRPTSLIEAITRIALLEKLQEAGLVSSKKIVPLKEHSEEVAKQLRKKDSKWNEPFVAKDYAKLSEPERKAIVGTWLEEIRATEKMRSQIHRIVAEVK